MTFCKNRSPCLETTVLYDFLIHQLDPGGRIRRKVNNKNISDCNANSLGCILQLSSKKKHLLSSASLREMFVLKEQIHGWGKVLNFSIHTGIGLLYDECWTLLNAYGCWYFPTAQFYMPVAFVQQNTVNRFLISFNQVQLFDHHLQQTCLANNAPINLFRGH